MGSCEGTNLDGLIMCLAICIQHTIAPQKGSSSDEGPGHPAHSLRSPAQGLSRALARRHMQPSPHSCRHWPAEAAKSHGHVGPSPSWRHGLLPSSALLTCRDFVRQKRR